MRSIICELAAEGTVRGQDLESFLWEWLKKKAIPAVLGNPIEPITPAIFGAYRKFYDILENGILAPWTEITREKHPAYMRKKRFAERCPYCNGVIEYHQILFSMTNGLTSPFMPPLMLMKTLEAIAFSSNDRPIVGICVNGHRVGAIRKYCRVNEFVSWAYHDLDT